MEKTLSDLYQQLQRLLTLHRQLLDALRSEREALAGADVTKIEELAMNKQGLLDQIALADEARRRLIAAIGAASAVDPVKITLSRVAIIAQGVQVRLGDQFRSVQQALSHVLTRVEEQGNYNRELVERSLETLVQMKRNILGGEAPRSGTYSSKGQASTNNAGARLISKEV